MDECEYCGGIAEYDVIADSNYIRICKFCVDRYNMVVIEKPSKIQIDESYKRPTVRQVLSRMAGIRHTEIKQVVPSLNTLRKPTENSKMKDRLLALSNPQKEDKVIETKDIIIDKKKLSEEEFLDI